jgi:hypothetical protein
MGSARQLIEAGRLLCSFTDLGGTYSLDRDVDVVSFVLAYDVLSTLPNWDNLRLLDSEVLGERLPDSLRTPLEHYRRPFRHGSLLVSKPSRRLLL